MFLWLFYCFKWSIDQKYWPLLLLLMVRYGSLSLWWSLDWNSSIVKKSVVLWTRPEFYYIWYYSSIWGLFLIIMKYGAVHSNECALWIICIVCNYHMWWSLDSWDGKTLTIKIVEIKKSDVVSGILLPWKAAMERFEIFIFVLSYIMSFMRHF